MKKPNVAIVCYEDPDKWILGKFARKMHLELQKNGYDSIIVRKENPSYEINHHIIYLGCPDTKSSSVHTMLITHVDSFEKLGLIWKQLTSGNKFGICMSKDTMNKLTLLGVPAERLKFINPPHDFKVTPRKIIIGIANKVHPDGRSRNWILSNLSKRMNLSVFNFKIMGEGWDQTVTDLKKSGAIVEYEDKFDNDKYIKMIPQLDYFLYLGLDEGSMAFLDALAAGVKTIVTPQGYHLDLHGGITYPFLSEDDLAIVFKKIIFDRNSIVSHVDSWSWENYTLKHIELWKSILTKVKVKEDVGIRKLKFESLYFLYFLIRSSFRMRFLKYFK